MIRLLIKVPQKFPILTDSKHWLVHSPCNEYVLSLLPSKCIIFVFSLAREIAEFFPFPPSCTIYLLFPTIPRFWAVSYKTLKGTKLDLNNGACKWLIYPHLGSSTMYSNYDVIDRLGRGKRVLLHIRIVCHLWLGQNDSSYIKVITIKASL